jgi:succinate dehydrogenase/fumarate reductase flavoprotein subunit
MLAVGWCGTRSARPAHPSTEPIMDTVQFEALVIGAGIAGASAAAALAGDRRVALIEAEEHPGYHTKSA